MCNASTARSVMTPRSGRQMTSFISQSKPRNTHLGSLRALRVTRGYPQQLLSWQLIINVLAIRRLAQVATLAPLLCRLRERPGCIA